MDNGYSGSSLSGESSSSIVRSFAKMDLVSNPDLDDLFNINDDTTPSSSSSSDHGPFDRNEPFILELHDLKRDSANTRNPETQTKIKKLRKKRKGKEPKNKQSSSSSPSEGSIRPHSDAVKEEYYDAQESYHGLTPNALPHPAVAPVAPAIETTVMQAQSDHGSDPKISLPVDPQTAVASAVQNAKALTKPVLSPD